MQKFLVIQTAFIGDVVLATGIIEQLHTFYPDAAIDFLVRKGNEGLLVNHPYLHEVLIWNKQQNKYRNLFGLLKTIRRRKYDKLINVQRFAATGLLTAFSGAKETIGFNKNPLSFLFTHAVQHQISTAYKPVHEIERNNKLIEPFTQAMPAKPRLYPSVTDYAAVQPYRDTKYICVAPASVWFTKQYPAEKWIRFINEVPAGYTVYLLGAPGDTTLCEKIQQTTTHTATVNLAGRLSFLQSAALQQYAVMNYVNDSAPMHFASSVNAPVTAVYCSTLPSFGFGPLSDIRFVVETAIPLPCKPCGLHGQASCPQQHFKCALTITETQLLASINL